MGAISNFWTSFRKLITLLPDGSMIVIHPRQFHQTSATNVNMVEVVVPFRVAAIAAPQSDHRRRVSYDLYLRG